MIFSLLVLTRHTDTQRDTPAPFIDVVLRLLKELIILQKFSWGHELQKPSLLYLFIN